MFIVNNHNTRTKIEKFLHKNWPCNASQISEGLGFPKESRSKINLVTYHLKKMDTDGRVKLKKIGRNVVAWPIEIEKIRFLREFLEGI